MKVITVNQHTEGKQEISTSKWLSGLGAQIFLSVLVIGSVYMLNAGQSEYSGVMALGGIVAVMYFSSLVSGTPHPAIYWSIKIIIFLFTVIVLLVEMFSMFANYMATSAGSDLDQYREIKAAAKKELTRLEAKELMLMKGDFVKGDKGALLAETSRAIKAAKSEAKLVIDSNQKKAFDDLGKKLGIDNVEGIYRAMLGALLVLALPLIAAARNGTWCGLTLWIYNKQRKVLDKLLNPTENENVSGGDLEDKGGEEKEPTGKKKTGGDYEAAKQWVEKEFKRGLNIPAPKLKAATGTTADHQQKGIIGLLIDSGIITRKGASVKKYYRATAKEQAEKTMKNTSKFLHLQLVKSK